MPISNHSGPKKKIGVYLSVPPYVGGSFQYNQSILEAMNSLNHNEYDVFVLYRELLWEEYLQGFNFNKIYVPYHKWLNILGGAGIRLFTYLNYDVAAIRKIYSKIHTVSRQIDALNLDLVIFPAQEMLPAIVKTPSIAVIHDLMHRYEKFPEISSAKEYRTREYNYRNMCKSAKKIFVDSIIGKQHAIECYGEKYRNKICIMPFTPPLYLFEETVPEENEIKEIPEKFIFYPAQFWQHKNHKNLLLAVNLLKQQGVGDFQLLLVGSKKNGYAEAVSIIEQHKLQSNVKILGYVSDQMMRYLYKHARAMVMPSFCGPTNIPPLEAMAMGCPVAVSNVYGMPDQIGDGGILFNPCNIQEIADVLKKLWEDDDLCNSLSCKGLERSKKFSQVYFTCNFKQYIEECFN